MTDASKRIRPNILVTGTPCVGKTATASLIAERLDMLHVNIGDIIQTSKCHLEYDEQLQTHVLDEDKLLDILETKFDAPNSDNSDNDHDGDSDNDHDEIDNDNDNDNDNDHNDLVVPGVKGNIVTDYHACEIFPERWFDLVIVLRASTQVLYDRLEQRGYNQSKRSQNMECEIMQVILDEAKDSYANEVVVELQSNTIQEMEQNVDRVEAWYRQWITDHVHTDHVHTDHAHHH